MGSASAPTTDTNAPVTKNWFLIALADLFAAGLIGALLRAVYIWEIPFLHFRPWLHAHSHTAMLGWVFIGVVLVMLHDGGRGSIDRRTRWALIGVQAAVIGMLISFPIQSYGPVSITASTIHMLIAYYLLHLLWKKSAGWPRHGSRVLLRWAIAMFVLSTVGIWSIGPIIAAGAQSKEIYYWAIQLFLHFQFNGWFWFAAIAMGVRWAERQGYTIAMDRLTLALWVVSAILTYALAIAWSEPLPLVFATITLVPAVLSLLGDKIDWRVAVDYRFSDAVLAYASVATGFKGGGSNPRPFNAFQLLAFGPETLTAYEVGLKTDFFDRRVRLNVAAFLNKYSEIQSTASPCPGVAPPNDVPSACRINLGSADIKGVEIELFAEPVDGFTIDASLSHLDFQYTTINPAGGAQLDDPGTGMPPWKASLGAQYKAELGSAGSITPRVDVYYQDETFAGFQGTGATRLVQTLPSFTTVNARLTWRNENEDLSVSLEVTNLTDEYYLYSSFDQRANNGGRIVAPARPREWAVTVKKEF